MKLFEEGASPAEVNREVAVLRHLFGYAVRLGELAVNPASRLEPLPERAEDSWNPLTPEQAKKLLENLPNTSRDLFAFALYTGLRIGNVVALRWNQVNLAERKLTLPPSETKARKPLSIPLSRPALKILQRRLKLGKRTANTCL